MPSFPTSVKVFTTKLDGAGNNINAAHVNDIQDEVNAIEAGYLNATARLNSSALSALASTVASLNVSGASTFTGVAVFNGRPTIAAGATLSADQGIRSGSHNIVGLNTEGMTALSGVPFSVANAATVALTPASADEYTGLFVVVDRTNSVAAIFISSGSATSELHDPSATFSATADTASSANLYITGSILTLQNNKAGTVSFVIIGLGSRHTDP